MQGLGSGRVRNRQDVRLKRSNVSVLGSRVVTCHRCAHAWQPWLVHGVQALALGPEDCKAMMWLSLAGALGQMCIFYTIANFGALLCSIITTMRKVLQIALSVAAFGHSFTPFQIVGLVSRRPICWP